MEILQLKYTITKMKYLLQVSTKDMSQKNKEPVNFKVNQLRLYNVKNRKITKINKASEKCRTPLSTLTYKQY